MEGWNIGRMEYWSIGVMEYWKEDKTAWQGIQHNPGMLE